MSTKNKFYPDEDLNDIIEAEQEAFFKGGEGSGVKGHKTNKLDPRIDEYVDKFKMKMHGSTLQTAHGWVDGISNLSKEQKIQILKRIKPFTKN